MDSPRIIIHKLGIQSPISSSILLSQVCRKTCLHAFLHKLNLCGQGSLLFRNTNSQEMYALVYNCIHIIFAYLFSYTISNIKHILKD